MRPWRDVQESEGETDSEEGEGESEEDEEKEGKMEEQDVAESELTPRKGVISNITMLFREQQRKKSPRPTRGSSPLSQVVSQFMPYDDAFH